MSAPLDRPLDSVTPDPWTHLGFATPARLALGRSGASLPTREVLNLGLAHARARDAVHAATDGVALAAGIAALGHASLQVDSAAPDRAIYLRRPDFGRRLSAQSRGLFAASEPNSVDLALIVADGLSAAAIDLNALPLLAALLPRLAGRSLSPLVVARQARVALGDEIGALLGARMVVLLIGERPGLSAADSLGAYLTFAPRVGLTDASRNCVSNIRTAGLAPEAAAAKIAWLIDRAFALSLTGVALKDESDTTVVAGATPASALGPS
ncbi:MAG: ethanolamine ammonia-lyase subunit EutC [Janthinobacterium lividum]